ncbi:hypothetical protein SANTM175S_03673 [Streptomyces antimycoticus]
MSGSLVVTDCNDFDVALTDPYGHIVQVGPYNTQLVASIGLAIGWILRNRADNPGIEPGDMFLCSDPWVGGGLHQNDVALFAPPLFHDGKPFRLDRGRRPPTGRRRSQPRQLDPARRRRLLGVTAHAADQGGTRGSDPM